MGLPSKTTIQTMDYSFRGQSWVRVASKTGIDLDTLDYSRLGQPWWGVEEAGGASPQNITGAGAISSLETFGTTKLNLNVTAAGAVASAEAFGNATVQTIINITAAGGIASAEAFGNAQLNLNITTAGAIVSAQACGTPKVNLSIQTVGIATAESWGSPHLKLSITSVGAIASAEAFGTAKINLNILPSGIASTESFGNPVVIIEQFISGAGSVSSAEAWGTAYMLAVAYTDSDISIGNWTDQVGGTTNLWDTLNEIYAIDADYVKTEVTATPDALTVSLSDLSDPNTHDKHIVNYRFRKEDPGSNAAKLTVYLMQGLVTIASWVHENVGTSWIDAEQTLTTEQAVAITDYTALRLKFEVVEM